MRFYSEDDRTVNVAWYFVDESTPFIPFSTPFRSLNYDNERIGNPEILGEVYGAPRPWRNGSKVGDSLGTNFCGTADQWRNGLPVPVDPPTDLDSTGTPRCCDRNEPPPGFPCLNLPPSVQPAVLVLDLGGVADFQCDCSALRGQHVLTRYTGPENPCLWETAVTWTCGAVVRALIGFQVQQFATPYLEMDFLDSAGVSIDNVVYTGLAGWDGQSPATLTLFEPGSNPLFCSWPFTLIIQPP